MKGMILAAGFGTRLAELGLDLPKPLFPVLNVPLIRWAVAFLKGHGTDEIIVNLHHRGEMIREELGDGSALGVRIEYSLEEGDILGTGGGIKKALPFFGEETFVVMNGKIISDIDLHAAVAHHRDTGAQATMVLKPDPDAAKWGAIGVDTDGRVQRFLGAPDPAPAGVTEHMFTGVHILEPSFVEALPDGPCCIVRAGYKPGFHAGTSLSGYVHKGYFWDHSTPARWWRGNMNLLHRDAPIPHPPSSPSSLGNAPANVTITPPTHIAASATLHPGARIGPDVVVGPGATLHADVDISGAIANPNARVHGTVRHGVVTTAGEVIPVDPEEAGPHTGPALGTKRPGS